MPFQRGNTLGCQIDEDCWRIAIWRSSLSADAEGASGRYRNLSGKRTDQILNGFLFLRAMFIVIFFTAI